MAICNYLTIKLTMNKIKQLVIIALFSISTVSLADTLTHTDPLTNQVVTLGEVNGIQVSHNSVKYTVVTDQGYIYSVNSAKADQLDLPINYEAVGYEYHSNASCTARVDVLQANTIPSANGVVFVNNGVKYSVPDTAQVTTLQTYRLYLPYNVCAANSQPQEYFYRQDLEVVDWQTAGVPASLTGLIDLVQD